MRDASTFAWNGSAESEPFDVLFVLPMMGVFGGVADVLELANALVLEGLHVGVVLLEEIDRARSTSSSSSRRSAFRPRASSTRLPETRVLVATAYQTAPPVALAAARRPGMQTAYFVQDYEGWFGGDPVEVVAQTYDLVPQMTAISTWLADLDRRAPRPPRRGRADERRPGGLLPARGSRGKRDRCASSRCCATKSVAASATSCRRCAP
jgi:hypothetical protein